MKDAPADNSAANFDPYGGRPRLLNLTPKAGWWIGSLIFLFAITVWLVTALQETRGGWRFELRTILSDFHLADPPANALERNIQPAWRDIETLALIVIMGIEPILASYQWRGMSKMYGDMISVGSLFHPNAAQAQELSDQTTATRRHLLRRRTDIIARAVVHLKRRFLLASGTVSTTNTQLGSGLYCALKLGAVGLSGAVCYLAYQGQLESHTQSGQTADWWLDRTTPMWLVYLLIATIGISVILIQNIVGAPIILFFIRKFITLDLAVGFDVMNRDRQWGWAHVRTVLGTAYAGVFMNGIALLILVNNVSDNTWTRLSCLFLEALWLAVALFYAVVILILIPWRVKRFRRMQIDMLAPSAVDDGDFNADIAAKVDRYNSVPVVPFAGRLGGFALTLGTLANLIPLLGFVKNLA